MAKPDPQRQVYEQWVRSYAPELYRYACRLTGSPPSAEDLVQETFTEAWKSLAARREPTAPRAWLFQILRFRHARLAREGMRGASIGPLPDHSDDHPAVPVQPPLDALADRDALQSALASLSPQIRETFLMVFAERLTCRETAEALRIPVGTVLSRLDAARRALRPLLADFHREKRDHGQGGEPS